MNLLRRQIAYIEDGHLKQMGTHEELMQTCEEYRRMWALSEEAQESVPGGVL